MKTVRLIFFKLCVVFVTADAQYDEIGWSAGEPGRMRIIGGENAVEGQFPYQAIFRGRPNSGIQFFCGGAIISDRFILTAAHCSGFDEAPDPKNTLVIVGALYNSVGVVIEPEQIIRHEKWSLYKIKNDISLIRTATRIVFSRTIQPIALPKHNDTGNTPVIFAGWGRDSENFNSVYNLKFAKSQTLTKSECIERFEGHEFAKLIRDTSVCSLNLENVGACHGDSGKLNHS